MKKFFSAILLMTMMVFSVGTFVSCNDLVEEVETIKGQTSDIESTIKGLETQIAALETALAKAQSTADAALKAGDEAKAAAEQAKADAIKEAKAECEVLKAAFEKALEGKADVKALEDLATLVNAEIAGIDSELATISTAVEQLVATDTELKVQIAALEAYKAYADTAFVTVEEAQKEAQAIRDELTKLAEAYYTELYDLIGDNYGILGNLIDEIDVEVESLAALIETNAASIDEITGYLTSAIEDLDLLNGKVEKLEAGLEEVETKVATLEEKVEKIDTDLKTFTTVLKGLVSQIQSVVWVPGYDYTYDANLKENTDATLKTDITVDRYTWNGGNSQLRFLATYEISPKSLVSKFSNDAVKVYFSNDIATKAAEPQTYPAEIVSVDANTGRIVVRGRITDRKSEVFKLFTDQDSEVLDLVVALHIEENVTGTVDGENVNAGTSVTADYVPVNTTANVKELTELFYLFDTEKDNKKPVEVDANGLYEKTIYVPYTTAPANSTRDLFPIDVRMKIEGKYLTLAEAGKYFGTTYTAKYEVTGDPAYTDIDNDSTNGDDRGNFKVTDAKKVTAKVELAKAAKSSDVSKAVTVSVDKISVNGEELDYEFATTYQIHFGTTTDIKFVAHKVDWNYLHYYSGAGNYYFHDTYAFAFPEIEVASSPVDITQLKYPAPNGNLWDYILFNNSDPKIGHIKAYDANGKEIKDLLDGSEYIQLEALTSKVAKLTEVILPFTDEVVTYKAVTTVTDKTYYNMSYTVSFDITLGATPKDKEIDLGTFNINGSQSHGTRVWVDAVAKVVEVDGASLKLPTKNPKNAATIAPWNAWTLDKVESTPAPSVANTPYLTGMSYAYSSNYNATGIDCNTYINIPENADYGASYNVKESFYFYGIKYTFKAKVNLVKPEYKLVPNPRLVKNGVVELTGKVTLPIANGNTYTDGAPYALDQIDLRQYVNVEGETDDDKINNELIIAYEVKKTRDLGYGNFSVPEGVSIANATTETTNVTATNAWGGVASEALPTNILTWTSEDQYPDNVDYNPFNTINEVTVVFQLKSQDGNVKFGDPVEIKLVVPELVKFETTKTISLPFKNGDALTVANIYNALKITDLKNNKVINNQSTATGYKDAINFDNFFDYVYGKTSDPSVAESDLDATTPVYAYNVYDMDVVPDADNVKIYLKDSKTALRNTDYEFDAATGDVKLAKNTGNLTENVIIEIPVYLYHMYQGAHEHMTTVKVEFTK